MQQQEFTYLLQHPESVSDRQTEQLKQVLEDYPYFQSARAIYLKGLKNKESFKYNTALKATAAYTTDRSVLFDYITSETFNQNEISETIKHNSEYLKSIVVNDVDDISIEKSVTIDDALNKHIKDTERILDPYLFQHKADEAEAEACEKRGAFAQIMQEGADQQALGDHDRDAIDAKRIASHLWAPAELGLGEIGPDHRIGGDGELKQEGRKEQGRKAR